MNQGSPIPNPIRTPVRQNVYPAVGNVEMNKRGHKISRDKNNEIWTKEENVNNTHDTPTNQITFHFHIL